MWPREAIGHTSVTNLVLELSTQGKLTNSVDGLEAKRKSALDLLRRPGSTNVRHRGHYDTVVKATMRTTDISPPYGQKIDEIPSP